MAVLTIVSLRRADRSRSFIHVCRRPAWARSMRLRNIAMAFILMTTALGGAAMLALGCDLVVPLSTGLASFCDVAAVALITVFCAAMDDR